MSRPKSYGTLTPRLRQIAQGTSPKIAYLWPRDLPEGIVTHGDAIIFQLNIVSHIFRIVKGFLQNISDYFSL